MTFGDRIYSRRLQLNLTQTELGRQVGRTPTCISYWESDKREPNLTDLAKLAERLETSLHWLVLGEHYGKLGESPNLSGPSDVASVPGPGTTGGPAMHNEPTEVAA